MRICSALRMPCTTFTSYSKIVAIVLSIVLISTSVSAVKSLKAKVTDETYTLSLVNYTALNSQVVSQQVIIPPNTEIGVLIKDIPLGTQFLVVQAHSYIYNVTLTYQGESNTLSGTNVGFVHTVTALLLPMFYVSNDNAVNSTVMLAVIGYGVNAPVPGGCNMEFSTKLAPYLHLSLSNSLITVESQPAMFKKCSEPYYITYEFYHMYQLESDYTPASYFKAVSSMISPNEIRANGRLVDASPLTTPMRRLFSAYHGTGSVYALVATLYGTNISAAYIPTHTYACSMISLVNPCVSSPLSWTIVSVLLAILGTSLCLYGHYHFKTGLFIHGLLFSSLLTYTLTVHETATMPDPAVNFWLLLLLGLICGRFWVYIWNQFGHPFISTTLSALTLSSFIFLVFLYSPYGDYTLLQSDINYVLIFVCIFFLVLCEFSIAPRFMNIVSCAVLGSYLIIFALDYFFSTNLKYLAINGVRRLTVDNFNMATIDPPYQNVDRVLSILWGMLVMLGIISQRISVSGKPAFPPPGGSYEDVPEDWEEEGARTGLLVGHTSGLYYWGDSSNILARQIVGPSGQYMYA
uniref:Transmembrane 7 superfamily member 3 n=1 Tax=Cacopsylla melanoneura TaxID=428564 RepID=A0A8D9ES96_9HEMI